MWKYRCKQQLIILLVAFLAGIGLTYFAYRDPSSLELLQSMIPPEIFAYIVQHSYLIYLSGGFFLAGIANVFVIGNLLLNEWNISPFLLFFVAMLFPSLIIETGILLFPVTLAVSAYGWISLRIQHTNFLKKHNLKNEDELIRIYLIHHPLDEKVKPLADNARKAYRYIQGVYILGIGAVFSVFLLVNNLWISMLMIFFLFFAYQFLARYRATSFMPISQLLYEKCDPEACMSALLYYCKRGSHYRFVNQPLMAKCLVFMDDPSLAQDILETYSRPNSQAELTYWSVMSTIYYQLADENGLERCKEAISKIRMGFGRMTLYIKSEEQNAIQNLINLMNGDFSLCKQYYLDQLKRTQIQLTKVTCYYYIALISFVQKDFLLAQEYFLKVEKNGNKLYYVEKARHYLDLIHSMNLVEEDTVL